MKVTRSFTMVTVRTSYIIMMMFQHHSGNHYILLLTYSLHIQRMLASVSLENAILFPSWLILFKLLDTAHSKALLLLHLSIGYYSSTLLCKTDDVN